MRTEIKGNGMQRYYWHMHSFDSVIRRNTGIDIEKFLAAVLVVWGHLLPEQDALIIPINLIHMPVFFFISGLFLYRELRKYSLGVFFKRKVFRLLVPYFTWSLISFSFHAVINLANGVSVDQLISEAIEIFILARSVWFLIVLFILQSLMGLIYTGTKKMKSNEGLAFLGFYVIAVLFLPNRLFSLYKLKELYPFLLLGYGCNALDKRRAKILVKQYAVLVIPLFLAYCLYFSGQKNPFDSNTLYFGNINTSIVCECVLWGLGGLMGLLSLVGIASYVELMHIGKLIAEGGKYSMDIYVIHMLFVVFAAGAIENVSNELIRDGVSFGIALVIASGIAVGSSLILRKSKLYRLSVGLSI